MQGCEGSSRGHAEGAHLRLRVGGALRGTHPTGCHSSPGKGKSQAPVREVFRLVSRGQALVRTIEIKPNRKCEDYRWQLRLWAALHSTLFKLRRAGATDAWAERQHTFRWRQATSPACV